MWVQTEAKVGNRKIDVGIGEIEKLKVTEKQKVMGSIETFVEYSLKGTWKSSDTCKQNH